MSCFQEMGDLSDLAYEYRNSGVKIIGLAADVYEGRDDDIAEAKAMLKDVGATHTNLVSSKSVAGTILTGVKTVPTTKFYDSEGRLLAVVNGALSKEGWINLIETVANEKA